ncbi:MAG: hypothetical protein RI953_798 [Pseudomonadota bacterium]|jgi:hypothetical protein
MKIENALRRAIRKLSVPVVVLMSGGCGVEAGNPDSKGGKMVRLYVSPSSFQAVGAVSASIDGLSLLQGDSVVSKTYQSQKLDLLTTNTQASEDSSLALTVEMSDAKNELQKVELTLAKDNPYLQVTLAAEAQPVKAAVVSESGEVVRSLVFNGIMNSAAALDVVIDLELRKTLKVATPEERVRLKLPEDVRFIIQQKHSFMNFAESGSIAFSDFAPGSLVCVFVGETLPTAAADACTEKGFKSQIISTRGTAMIGALAAGEYRTVNITLDNKVVELKRATVSPGKKVALSSK